MMGVYMSKFGFDDSELAQLFADAGAAVNKARQSEPKKMELNESLGGSESMAFAEKITTEAGKEAPSSLVFNTPINSTLPSKNTSTASIPSGKTINISSGQLEDDSLIANSSDSQTLKIVFSNIKSLILGRIEIEQILAFKYNNSVFFISDKAVNLKGMVPKMAFSAPENWRNFIVMFAEKSGATSDAGIQAVLSGSGLIPKYSTKETLFEQLG